MTNYSIQIKKGEMQYSVSSADRAFIANYIEDFFNSIKSIPVKTFDTNELPKLYAEKTEPKAETQVLFAEKSEEKTMDEMVKSLFDKSAEETIRNLDETFNSNVKTKKEDLSDLTTFLEPKNNRNDKIVTVDNSGYNFDSILEDKINNPVFEEEQPVKTFDYDELLKTKQPSSLTDYLIITAYYMLENENIETFQLKQLNAKLFSSMNMVVDRKTVQKAVDDGYLSVVSDGIQNDGAVEYALTYEGQEFYTNGLA